MDRQLFEKTVWSKREKLFRIALYFLKDPDSAEDATQELLTRIWEKRDRLNGIKNMEAFLVQSLKNHCLDRMKSGHQVFYTDDLSSFQYQTNLKPETRELPDTFDQVRKEIEHLPEKQKLVMMLRDIEGYDLEEIGYITGLQPVNIRVTLSRARKNVREKLKKKVKYEHTGS